jgi:hypothetical protein
MTENCIADIDTRTNIINKGDEFAATLAQNIGLATSGFQ